MRGFLLATSILAGNLISNGMIAQADPLAGSANAPPAEAPAVRALDNKLSICRADFSKAPYAANQD
jgi:hypothetical protein